MDDKKTPTALAAEKAKKQLRQLKLKREKGRTYRVKVKKNKQQAMIDAMEHARLEEYAMYMEKPWRLLGMNFLIGLARGLGMTIGLALVLALLVFGAAFGPSGQSEKDESLAYLRRAGMSELQANIALRFHPLVFPPFQGRNPKHPHLRRTTGIIRFQVNKDLHSNMLSRRPASHHPIKLTRQTEMRLSF